MKAVVVALAALWAGAAFAQGPATESNAEAKHMQNLAVLLDLTEAQSAQVQAILEDEHQQMRQAFESAKAAGTKPDWQQMKTLHQQLEQDTITKLTPVLNATQLKKFQVLMQMHRPHHHGPPPGMTPTPAGEPAAAPSTSH
jgi:hypothetical protein